MYQRCYAEVLEDDQNAARRAEFMALDKAVTMLMRADEDKDAPFTGIGALHYTRELWTTFANELVSPDNALPERLRANLISIAIWILKEADAIRLGRSTNFAGIADICGIVRDGLR